MPYHSIRNNTFALTVSLSLAFIAGSYPAWAQDTTVTQEKARQEKSRKEAKAKAEAEEAMKAKKGKVMPESPSGAEKGKWGAESAAGAGKNNGETEHFSVCSSKPWLCK